MIDLCLRADTETELAEALPWARGEDENGDPIWLRSGESYVLDLIGNVDGQFLANLRTIDQELADSIPAGLVITPASPQRGWLVGPEPEPVPETPVEPTPPTSGVTILYPADLWRRTTDEEAEQIEAAIESQPVRLRNIFRTASLFRSDDELWPLLTATATALFGDERAAELLAAS